MAEILLTLDRDVSYRLMHRTDHRDWKQSAKSAESNGGGLVWGWGGAGLWLPGSLQRKELPATLDF